MRPRPLSAVAAAVDGELVGDDVTVSSVSTDSRVLEPGALFVALEGERRDGHGFVADAFAAGAAAALVRRGTVTDGPAVTVASTGDALLALGADERERSDATVVAITGANGKTSTKDMTAAVLGRRYRIHASPRSFNNEIGTPLTLLGAAPDTEVVVAELGARREGDVALLCRIARPDVVVVTNVGVAHLEVFGSWEAIVRAAAEPVDALGTDGTAVLNADDPVVAGLADRTDARAVTFGRAAGADVRAEDVRLDPDARPVFELVAGHDRAGVRLAVPGDHMVPNALAAAAVGIHLGVPLADCALALGDATVAPWRMETFWSGGVRVLNDAYNANPESMAAALRTAMVMAGEGRVLAVLGQMAELGPIGAQEHERVGELVARLGVARLITVGPEAKAIAVAALREGVEPEHVADYDDLEAAREDVRAHARPGDVVLVKASRVAGLERLAEALR
ncbi:MAG TPA: UDP-N-acetylmuramoyl-tripeptide--D-alanyl-D-alanine ligase [Actinomycetota bacterium]|nr:UDP-N-acetylmuramoyl-tripeptide--D-alanyl-D-alanine ligase [Actinomycetota bacterium]